MSAPTSTLLAAINTAPHQFLQPTLDLQRGAVSLAKQYFDPIAYNVSLAQQNRLQAERKNRKRRRGQDEPDHSGDVLRLKKVHTEGFAVQQVWEQVKRIADAVSEEIERGLKVAQYAPASNGVEVQPDGKSSGIDDGLSQSESASEDSDDEENLADIDAQEEMLDEENEEVDFEDGDLEGEDSDLDIVIDEEGEDGLEGQDGDEQEEQTSGDLVEDVHGLNDGFFSIDDFNRQTEFLEQVDARGDPDDGAASDEEDVDWEMNPMDAPLPADGPTKPRKAATQKNEDVTMEDDEDDSDDDAAEGGPTFGNMSLDAPEGASDDEDDLDDELHEDSDEDMNANDIRYKDFFAPPAKKRNKKGPPMKHNFPAKSDLDNIGDELQRNMKAVRRDLYSDDEEDDQDLLEIDGRELEELDPSDPKSRRSNHDRRQAALTEEIRRLEAKNVSRKPWTLSGEASAGARPLNSLLEEDLDFERTGKPVPVITKEISEDIEALIKRRILAREFDEILRRRPDELLKSTGVAGRRGVLEEVSTSKSQKGLGELYEEEHLKRTDPNYVDQRDEVLKAAHLEIENLWKDVAGKLDSLCSWNYRPKPVEMSVQVRSDAPVVMMEDARPSGAGGAEVALQSQLAPQEVYKTGAADAKQKGEVVTKGGNVLSKEELSREEKQRLRKQEKGRKKKAAAQAAVISGAESGKRTTGEANAAKQKGKKGKDKERQGVVNDLKKGGVMVIGRKGELVDVEGKKGRAEALISAGGLKL